MNQREYLEKGQALLKRFHELTYEAFFVGGMVRDYVMKNDFVDIDIATSATPQEINKFFPNVNMDYAADGCVIIKDGEYEFEVSTFKREEYASISRHPSAKYYSTNLSDDIDRRDYTVNALAMTQNLKVIDLCKGLKDIKRKRINVIGRPKKRYKEDPVRILRGFELIARFGFHFTFRTKEGIRQSVLQLTNISDNKLNEKMFVIFDSKYGKKALKQMLKLKVVDYLRAYSKGIELVKKNFNKLSTEEKFALCFYLNGSIPQNLSLDRVMLTKIKTILKTLEELKDAPVDRMHIFHYGADILSSVDRIRTITNKELKSSEREIERLGRSMPINSASELEFKGNDVLALTNGATGPFVSEVIEALRQKVVIGEIKNSFEDLNTEAKNILIEKGIIEGQIKKVKGPVKEVKENDLEQLKQEYLIELEKLVKANLDLLLDDEMTEEEVQETTKQVENNMKKMLLKKKPKYNALVEGGLI
ncbi:MAG: hypothetical protein IJX78_07865 [Bacilli bacterium]|nr:hypothetical protein [Bacilli bacterium]